MLPLVALAKLEAFQNAISDFLQHRFRIAGVRNQRLRRALRSGMAFLFVAIQN
jgi:hypothetical protein